MKRLTIFIFLIALTATAWSQNAKNKKSFRIGADAFTDVWMEKPDGMKLRGVNQGANINLMYYSTFPKTNFSIGTGAVLSMHNLYSNMLIEDLSADTTKFTKIPEGVDYKKNKISIAYLELPVEFKYTTKSQFSFAMGMKIGLPINTHTKYKGKNPNGNGKEIKVKEHNIKGINDYRMAATMRIGYQWISLFASYQLTTTFDKDKGPDLYPVSVGISISPY